MPVAPELRLDAAWLPVPGPRGEVITLYPPGKAETVPERLRRVVHALIHPGRQPGARIRAAAEPPSPPARWSDGGVPLPPPASLPPASLLAARLLK